MKHLSTLAIGVVAALLGWVTGPIWVGQTPLADPGNMYNPYIPVFPIMLFYAPILIALGAAVIGTLDAAHLATRRSELAALRALGRTRGGLVRAEVLRRTGLHAAVSVGGLVLGSLAALLLRVAAYGSVGHDAAVDWGAVFSLGAVLVVLVASSALGTLAAALWATGSPAGVGAGARATAADDAVPSRGGLQSASDPEAAPVRRRRRWPWWTAGGLVLFVGIGFAFPFLASDGGVVPILLAIALSLALYLALPALLVWGGASLGSRTVSALGRMAARRADPGTTRGLASDALARRVPLRTAAVGAIGLVIAVASGTSIVLNSNAARNELSRALIPDAVVSSVPVLVDGDYLGEPDAPPGWAPALDAEVVAALQADDRLVVVPVAVLVTERTEIPSEYASFPGEMQPGQTVIALTPEALHGLADASLRAMYLADGVQLASTQTLVVGDTSVATDTPSVASPFVTISRPWAEDVFGDAADSALLVYVADTLPRSAETPLQYRELDAILAEHDLEDEHLTWPARYESYDVGSRADAASLLLIAGPFMLGAVGIVLALTAATQRLRAREHATLAALGVRAGTLRAAAALEAGTVTAVGSVLGLAAGVVLGTSFSALNGAGGLGIRLWNVGFDLSQTPWVALVTLVLAATAIAAGLAALLRVRVDARTPAEQLRQADKEGVR
ncbi:FtsX-like permease family protein [Demequina zhanjiangensis]|uniref:ABC3 transporter permease C-terminal domain-containing protein n=1 Tax=Demequina zhanjiangensis TaxID=3051659 RepID=A0ABT8FZ90_9MICO|nr:FtsX-like permease family protein [Demequina sp. SYSU T00b26]MDN4472211.1 hypothetical protein [Demequina sp. SYSU T00b26]